MRNVKTETNKSKIRFNSYYINSVIILKNHKKKE